MYSEHLKTKAKNKRNNKKQKPKAREILYQSNRYVFYCSWTLKKITEDDRLSDVKIDFTLHGLYISIEHIYLCLIHSSIKVRFLRKYT